MIVYRYMQLAQEKLCKRPLVEEATESKGVGPLC